MLSREERTAILELHKQGLGTRAIKKALNLSRGAIKKVIASSSQDPTPMVRATKPEPYRDLILELYKTCAYSDDSDHRFRSKATSGLIESYVGASSSISGRYGRIWAIVLQFLGVRPG